MGLAGACAGTTALVSKKETIRDRELGIKGLVVIGAISVALSLVGLAIGRQFRERLGGRRELVGGAVLILVGVAIGTGLLQDLA